MSKLQRIRNAAKPFFQVKASADGVLQIDVYSVIGSDYWSDSEVTARAISRKLAEAGSFTSILLRINSPGGDAFEGIAIYNLIRAQKKPVEVHVDGVAASAASIIAMAGDTIIMGVNTMMMMHNAWGWCMGYASEMRKQADALDKISGAIAQTYVSRAKKTLEEVVALMDAETWMTAQECLTEGFATGIEDADDRSAAALAMARGFKAFAKMAKLPESLKSAAADVSECECECEACMDGDCANCSNSLCEDSNCLNCPMQADNQAKLNAASFEAVAASAAARVKVAAASGGAAA